MGKADRRLMDEEDGGRRLSGIGILWHSSVGATLIGDISSDRICGIRFSVDYGVRSVMSATGVYLPCLGQGIGCHCEHPIELERVVSDQLRPGVTGLP